MTKPDKTLAKRRPLAAALSLCAVAAACCAAPSANASGPALLFDVKTGHVLYAKQPDQRWYPASLTKIMTAYLAFRAIKDGRLQPDQKIVTSETAHKMPPSKIGLPVGAEMSLDLALRSLIIKSANDVSVMLAEAIDGSVAAFADRMNRTARRLGMVNTHFVNPNGLPDPGQVTSARDLAKLTRVVLAEFPEHAHFWATRTMRIGRIRLRSHNTLLNSYAGASGVKTGFICDSGFNIVASAAREGQHLAAVVLGDVTPRDRASRARALLTHGFETRAWKQLLGAPTLETLPTETTSATPPSIRGQIKVWDCGRKPAAKRPKPAAQRTAEKRPTKNRKATQR